MAADARAGFAAQPRVKTHFWRIAVAYQLLPFASIELDEALLDLLIAEHESVTLPRLRRLWSYYRNALAEPSDRGGSLGAPAQAAGLPSRLNNPPVGEGDEDIRLRREIVIENDIAWRMHTLVDFMFPEAPKINSTIKDPHRAEQIEAILQAVITANGGTALWHDAALLGAVYGQVDFLLNCNQLERIGAAGRRGTIAIRRHGTTSPSHMGAGIGAGAAASHAPATLSPDAIAQLITLEIIEAPRAIPLMDRSDYRKLDAYILHFQQLTNDVDHGGLLAREREVDQLLRVLQDNTRAINTLEMSQRRLIRLLGRLYPSRANRKV